MTASRKAATRSANARYAILVGEGTRAFSARLATIWCAVATAFATLVAGRLRWDGVLDTSLLLPFGVFSAAVAVEWLLLRRRAIFSDLRLFEIATFLVGVGLAIQSRMGTFSGSGFMGFKLALPAGFAAMLAVYFAASGRRWEKLEKTGPVCLALAAALLAAMAVLGRRYRGGIYLPGNVNPSEFAKPLLVVFLAAFLAGHRRDFSATTAGVPAPPLRSLARLAALWCIPNILAMALHDLGLVLLINAVLVVMLYAVGRRPGYLVLGALGVAGAGWVLWLVSSHVRTRFLAWLDPFADPTGGGWQVLQGLSAMYAGGIWGAGIGAGSPESVPIVTSDFVYAAVCEELGLLAAFFVLALYAALFLRGFSAAGRAKSPFGELLATGLCATLAVQAILNLGGVTKALPLTGIVLPFLSQGGSGFVAMLAMTGLLAAVGSED